MHCANDSPPQSSTSAFSCRAQTSPSLPDPVLPHRASLFRPPGHRFPDPFFNEECAEGRLAQMAQLRGDAGFPEPREARQLSQREPGCALRGGQHDVAEDLPLCAPSPAAPILSVAGSCALQRHRSLRTHEAAQPQVPQELTGNSGCSSGSSTSAGGAVASGSS